MFRGYHYRYNAETCQTIQEMFLFVHKMWNMAQHNCINSPSEKTTSHAKRQFHKIDTNYR